MEPWRWQSNWLQHMVDLMYWRLLSKVQTEVVSLLDGSNLTHSPLGGAWGLPYGGLSAGFRSPHQGGLLLSYSSSLDLIKHNPKPRTNRGLELPAPLEKSSGWLYTVLPLGSEDLWVKQSLPLIPTNTIFWEQWNHFHFTKSSHTCSYSSFSSSLLWHQGLICTYPSFALLNILTQLSFLASCWAKYILRNPILIFHNMVALITTSSHVVLTIWHFSLWVAVVPIIHVNKFLPISRLANPSQQPIESHLSILICHQATYNILTIEQIAFHHTPWIKQSFVKPSGPHSPLVIGFISNHWAILMGMEATGLGPHHQARIEDFLRQVQSMAMSSLDSNVSQSSLPVTEDSSHVLFILISDSGSLPKKCWIQFCYCYSTLCLFDSI
jgi:hypothetical protein